MIVLQEIRRVVAMDMVGKPNWDVAETSRTARDAPMSFISPGSRTVRVVPIALLRQTCNLLRLLP